VRADFSDQGRITSFGLGAVRGIETGTKEHGLFELLLGGHTDGVDLVREGLRGCGDRPVSELQVFQGEEVATIDFASATVGVDVTSGHIVASWAGAALESSLRLGRTLSRFA